MKIFAWVIILLWAASLAPTVLEANGLLYGDAGHGWAMISVFFLWPFTALASLVFLIAAALNGRTDGSATESSYQARDTVNDTAQPDDNDRRAPPI
jgi:hypothetical protein